MKKAIYKKGKQKKKIKIRKFWAINPRTKIKENAKIYRRTEKKRELKDILKEFCKTLL
jgi:hypothetical protein